MKILLVEDSATLRYAMSHSITSANHQALIAENGEQARKILKSTAVDMIIMDVEMPGLDGFETTRLIREMFKDHWIPIIFVTGKNDERDLREGIDAGGDDYLIKPVSEVILLAKIRAMERIILMRDQLNKLNQELTILSEHDSLTKLLNRRTFEDRVVDIWRIASRNREPVTLLLLDIDHFKRYNDTYGHLAGDECIKRVAQAIASCVNRPGDILARYGGEEFIALLPNTPERGAHHVARLIKSAIESLNIVHEGSPTSDLVTVSIGGAVVNQTAGVKLRGLIHAADKALYQAKKRGRNAITIKLVKPANSLVVACSEKSEIIHRINEGLERSCSIFTTSQGDELFDLISKSKPDAVLIDEGLPDIKTSELISSLRQNPDTTGIPIIYLHNAKNGQETQEELPVSISLNKPVEDVYLVHAINRFLGHKVTQ